MHWKTSLKKLAKRVWKENAKATQRKATAWRIADLGVRLVSATVKIVEAISQYYPGN